MELNFDITEDELPVFMAESGEHLQNLDEGLVRLEREGEDPELLQALFRSAHTLKGSSGMIGHKRMVELTHAMETALDSLRKGQIKVTPPLIDVCLEAVDALRALCDEVPQRTASSVDIKPMVEKFLSLSKPASQTVAEKPVETAAKTAQVSSAKNSIIVRAEISPDSIASAARAFQIIMALQDMGEILNMDPGQERIEAAEPVQIFTVELTPTKSVEEIRKELNTISEIDRLEIRSARSAPTAEPETEPASVEPPAEALKGEDAGARIGDYLVQNSLITAEQLKAALNAQSVSEGPVSLLGLTLVKMGFVTQEVLDEAVAEQKQATQATRPADTATAERTRAKVGEKTVRTSVERLDNLMNLVGELITDRNRLYMLRSELDSRFRGDNRIDVLGETITHVGRITDQLQAEVMGIRMLPISNVFNKFPRLVRDLARKANKQIDLVMRGEDTELDRSVIEEISDPLIHLLRNSVDHGLETPTDRLNTGKLERGTILLTARHEQGRIIITVEDDGRGIDIQRLKNKAIDKGWMGEKEANALSDEEAIDLIFISGLSTAKTISDISGRGVGMDIVRNNIERLNGSVHVETWPGKGSRFSIVLPLTLAIMPTLLVRVCGDTYAIPLVMVTETLLIPQSDIHTINSRPVIRLRNHVLPVTRLTDVFEMQRNINDNKQDYVVVVRSGKTQLGLIVDTLVGEQEVVVKSLSSIVGDVLGISGAAILGDGSVALIVDVQGLLKLAASVPLKFN